MKTPIVRASAVIGAIFAVISMGCARPTEGGGTRLFQIPWPTASGEYEVQRVQIDSFDQPESMQGQIAKILVDPYVSGGELQSSTPVGRFVRTSEDALVPADFVTLQATAVYAHLERLHQVDSAVGIAPLINWPMKIALQANVVDDAGSLLNNALYDGKLDALLIVPYFSDRLPITLNAGILAHEHFHKLFQVLVLNKIQATGAKIDGHGHLMEACDWALQERGGSRVKTKSKDEPSAEIATPVEVPVRVYNQFLVRGLNEGLADFWGWVYTGDVSYIGRSLNSLEADQRRLNETPKRLDGVETLKANLKSPFTKDGILPEEKRVVEAYRLGTRYARFMRQLALEVSGGVESDKNARLVAAKALIAALPMIGDIAAGKYSTEYLSPDSLLKPLYLNLPNVSQAACGMYDNFASIDSSEKPTVCVPKETAPAGKDGENEGAGASK